MSASENLTPDQFQYSPEQIQQFPQMSMRRIMKLPSIDARDPWNEYGRGHRMSTVVQNKAADVHADRWGVYEDVRKSMYAEGQRLPVHIATVREMEKAYGITVADKYKARLMMGNGSHRVSIAHAAGWPSMRYTPNRELTADHTAATAEAEREAG
jgi:hypothetical protein